MDIRVIKHLYDKAHSAVLFNGSIGDWFQTTVGVRNGCLISPTIFNIFLERITTDASEDHEVSVSIWRQNNHHLRFADDIDGLAGEEEELVQLVERLFIVSTVYDMEIHAEKIKLMTNNTSGINKGIKVSGLKLERVTHLKYLGSVITDEDSKPEKHSRIAQTSAAMARLKTLEND